MRSAFSTSHRAALVAAAGLVTAGCSLIIDHTLSGKPAGAGGAGGAGTGTFGPHATSTGGQGGAATTTADATTASATTAAATTGTGGATTATATAGAGGSGAGGSGAGGSGAVTASSSTGGAVACDPAGPAICTLLSHATATCSTGMCVITGCTGAYEDCNHVPSDGCESRPKVDPLNCGTCGVMCAAGQKCAGGMCK